MFDSVPEFHYNDDVREVWTLSNIVVRDKIINFTLLLTNNTCAFSVAASLSPPEVSWFVTLLAVTVDFSTLWWAPCSASVLTAQSLLSSRVCVCVCVSCWTRLRQSGQDKFGLWRSTYVFGLRSQSHPRQTMGNPERLETLKRLFFFSFFLFFQSLQHFSIHVW